MSRPSPPVPSVLRLPLILAAIAGLALPPAWSAESDEPHLALADLPFPVRDTVVATVAGKKLQDIVLLLADGARIYQVRYRDEAGQMQTARIDGNGRLLVDGATPGDPSRSPSSIGTPLTAPTAGGATRTSP